MKRNLLLLLSLLAGMALAQAPVVDVSISVTDNAGGTQALKFGLDAAATDGIDATLGEVELPPTPPSGVFDARFVGDDISLPQLGQGTYKDYRGGDENANGTETHEIKFQPGSGTAITINWQLPNRVSGLLQDLFGGVLINQAMSGDGNYTVTNPGAISRLKMIVTYAPQSITLTAPNGAEMWETGTVKNITWESAGISNIAIDYSIDNGNNWIDVTGSTPAAVGNFSWMVPTPASTQARVRIRDASDGIPSDESELAFAITTQIEQNLQESPVDYTLAQNYPNPFNPETIIEFGLPRPGYVRIEIYNLLGLPISVLVDGQFGAGPKMVKWDGRDNDGRQATSGVYFYRIDVGNFTATRKLLLMR